MHLHTLRDAEGPFVETVLSPDQIGRQRAYIRLEGFGTLGIELVEPVASAPVGTARVIRVRRYQDPEQSLELDSPRRGRRSRDLDDEPEEDEDEDEEEQAPRYRRRRSYNRWRGRS